MKPGNYTWILSGCHFFLALGQHLSSKDIPPQFELRSSGESVGNLGGKTAAKEEIPAPGLAFEEYEHG
jgi:hypothetical protein